MEAWGFKLSFLVPQSASRSATSIDLQATARRGNSAKATQVTVRGQLKFQAKIRLKT